MQENWGILDIFSDPGVYSIMYLYWFLEGILNVALVNGVTFSDVSIMRAVSSARSSCLCWKERCIETEYIVIILLPTSLFLSSYKGQWTELRLSANTYRRGEEEDLPVLLFCFYVSVWFCCCNYSVFISSVYLLWMVPSYLWINISPLENSTWVV